MEQGETGRKYSVVRALLLLEEEIITPREKRAKVPWHVAQRVNEAEENRILRKLLSTGDRTGVQREF